MGLPLVSVCLPVFNGAGFISEAIESVRQQTFTDWELVIVDNASHDGTSEILAKIQASSPDPRISVFRNSTTLAMAENWNVALAHTQAPFLKLLCADDVLVGDCLERQAKALQAYPKAALASGARIIINRRGQKLFCRNGIGRTGLYPGASILQRSIWAGTNLIGDPVHVMWRRAAMVSIGRFDPQIVYCTDLDFWLRLLSQGDLFFDAQPVGLYRIHSAAMGTRLTDVTVNDFIRTVSKQEACGNVRIGMFWNLIRFKSWAKSVIRQTLYRILG